MRDRGRADDSDVRQQRRRQSDANRSDHDASADDDARADNAIMRAVDADRTGHDAQRQHHARLHLERLVQRRRLLHSDRDVIWERRPDLHEHQPDHVHVDGAERDDGVVLRPGARPELVRVEQSVERTSVSLIPELRNSGTIALAITPLFPPHVRSTR